jgi:mono/diheme cytochrome c family protein
MTSHIVKGASGHKESFIMTRVSRFLILVASFLLQALPEAGGQDKKPSAASLDDSYNSQIKPLLAAYCFKCHGADPKPKSDLNLTRFATERSVRENWKLFRDLVTKVRSAEMPPEKNPQPKPEERQAIIDWVEAALARSDPGLPMSPGRVVCRRLNRVEYRNVVRDLLGVDFNTHDEFPSDDVGHGFDNIGDVLSLPPILMEKYVAAARKIVERGLASPQKDELLLIAKPDDKTPKREAAKIVLSRFASRAYRRPVGLDELEKLLKLFDAAEKQDASFEGALKLPLRAVLISPHFLFRFEQNVSASDAAGVQQIGDFEVAGRLSFFLWSSMPDDRLFATAVRNKLGEADAVASHALRLLEDPRSIALAENFVPQWLQVRRLEEMAFDPKFGMDKSLRQDMIRETVLFFDNLVREDRSVLELLDADYTFVNDRLARHYGIPGVSGGEFRRVRLADGRRGGVMLMAAVLAATSDPNRTSPVKRGKWVLEAIFGTPPPPPIPGADNIKEDASTAGMTLRQKMERHRSDPKCATCHSRMDPIGFGLDNYDASGAWRDTEDGKPIDVSAKLPDGKAFRGAAELKAIIMARNDEFVRCLVERMLTYALGRGVEPSDAPVVDRIAAAVAKDKYRISTLVVEVVKSYPFRYRQKDGGKR